MAESLAISLPSTRTFHVGPALKNSQKTPGPQGQQFWTFKSTSIISSSMAWMLTYISNLLIRYIITHLSSPNNYDLIPPFFHLFSITSLIGKVRTIKPRTNLTGYPAKTPDIRIVAALDLFRIFTYRLEKKSGKGYNRQFTVGMYKCCENCLKGLKHWNIILKLYI